jgi:hypothetical protein
MLKQNPVITMVDCENRTIIYNKTENHKQPALGKPSPEPMRVEQAPSPGTHLTADDLRSPQLPPNKTADASHDPHAQD